MSLRRLYRLDEFQVQNRGNGAQNLAQQPWRPTPGGTGWSKRSGQVTATVTMSRRGDGSFIVSSTMDAGPKSRRQQVPCRDEAQALAQAERMKLELDSRAL